MGIIDDAMNKGTLAGLLDEVGRRGGIGLANSSSGLFGLGALSLARTANKRTHDGMLADLARYLKSHAALVCADLDGWSRPEKIYLSALQLAGHVPDATAWFGMTKCVFEVETSDTIGIEHTRSQCEAFAADAERVAGRFVLVVPSVDRHYARAKLNSWNIRGEVWWPTK